VQWQPELSVSLIEAAAWGNTVASAATARAYGLATEATELPALTALLEQVVLANVGDAVGRIMDRLQEESARAPDIALLMDGLPALANVSRYSDVRRTDLGVVANVVDGFVVRITVGLAAACSSLDDAAAAAMRARIEAVSGAIALLEHDEHAAAWHGAIRHLADSDRVHGAVAGRCARLLFDAGALAPADAAQRLSRTLSAAEAPARAAAWVEGFLAGSGQLLLHDDALWQLIDQWLMALREETLVALLPLLRRAFSAFAAPERRQLGDRARRPSTATGLTTADGGEFDEVRAGAGLRTVLTLLGLEA
jgi:hypothetical protein